MGEGIFFFFFVLSTLFRRTKRKFRWVPNQPYQADRKVLVIIISEKNGFLEMSYICEMCFFWQTKIKYSLVVELSCSFRWLGGIVARWHLGMIMKRSFTISTKMACTFCKDLQKFSVNCSLGSAFEQLNFYWINLNKRDPLEHLFIIKLGRFSIS